MISRRSLIQKTALLGGGLFITGCLDNSPPPEEQILTAKESFNELQDIHKALDEGYVSTATHVHNEHRGLGEVFVSENLPVSPSEGDIDPEKPHLLYYQLNEDGTYTAAGVGWYVGADEVDEPPVLFGREFMGPVSGEFPGQPESYIMNAWVFMDNPDGLFERYHPSLTGPSYIEDVMDLRVELDKFRVDPLETAVDAGYQDSERHIYYDGGMYGVPFWNPDVVGVELERPGILIYRMTSSWYLDLMGVEWSVPVDEVDERPELLGQRFHEAIEGHSDEIGQPEHYGLHAWIFQANPAGMFAETNPYFQK